MRDPSAPPPEARSKSLTPPAGPPPESNSRASAHWAASSSTTVATPRSAFHFEA